MKTRYQRKPSQRAAARRNLTSVSRRRTASRKTARLKGAKEIYCPWALHGVAAMDPDRVNADLLEFIEGLGKA